MFQIVDLYYWKRYYVLAPGISAETTIINDTGDLKKLLATLDPTIFLCVYHNVGKLISIIFRIVCYTKSSTRPPNNVAIKEGQCLSVKLC